jgi:hypothetical protein
MSTKKKAVDAVSAANITTGVAASGTAVIPSTVSRGTVSPVGVSPVVSTGTTQGLITVPVAKLPKGFEESLQKLLAGVQTQLADGSSLTAVNGSYTKAQMVSTLQSAIALYTGVAAQETVLETARITQRAGIPAARQYYAELKGVITGFFHAGNPVLPDFGFTPKKAGTPMPAVKKAESVLRSAETRKLRGTLTKAQKAALKYTGPVTAASVPSAAPVVVAAAPAVVVQPATPAPTPAPVVPPAQPAGQ